MYLSELLYVVRDLQSCVGSHVSSIRQPRRDRLILDIGGRRILLVPRGPEARLCVSGKKTRSPIRPFSFQGACRAHIGGVLERLEILGDDRVVALTFSHGSLRLHLTGRGGGLWLLNGDGVVAAYDGPAKVVPALPIANPTERPPRFSPKENEDWAEAAGSFFGGRETEAATRTETSRLARALRTEIKRLTRLQRNLGDDVKSALAATTRRRAADSLSAVIYSMPLLGRSVTVPDLEDPDRVHTLSIDPSLSAGSNVSRLYNRVKRLEARGREAGVRLSQAVETAALTALALSQLEEGDATLAHSLVQPQVAASRQQSASGIQRWQHTSGQTLLIGRTGLNNRKLTFQIARGRDWWMHVRDLPGAHVVLPMRGGNTPPLEWLLAGAQLAASRSRIPVGTAGDVQYTQVKYVKAIPGAAPGLVSVQQERVLHIRCAPEMPDGWKPVP